MFTTDPKPVQEIIVPPWQNLPRGATMRGLSTLDLMIDIDEVVMPTVDLIHELAYQRGLHDGSRPMETWAGHEQYGCPEDVYWDLWSDFALSGGYTTSAPIPGAVEALREAYFAGHRIHFATARGFMQHATRIRGWTQEWLAEFAIPYHTLAFAHDKVAVQAELGIKFDFGFDDGPKNYTALAADGVRMYLVNHPHNAKADIPAENRIDSLAEGIAIVLQEAA